MTARYIVDRDRVAVRDSWTLDVALMPDVATAQTAAAMMNDGVDAANWDWS